MKKRLGFVILVLIFCGGGLLAQEDPQFTQFQATRLFFNPAFAGVDKETQISLTHRSQWATYTGSFESGGAPTTQVFSFNTALLKYQSGIGFHIVHDQIGPLNNIEIQASYAFHIPMQNNSTLSIGVRGGLYNQIIDFDDLRTSDPIERDILLSERSGRQAFSQPDFAVGVYYKSDRLFLGATANHIAALESGGLLGQGLVESYYLMGGYNIPLDARERLIVTPTFLAKTSQFNEFSIDAGALLSYTNNRADKKFIFGSTFRNEESINAILGFEFDRRVKKNKYHNIRIGYSFDYVYGGQEAKEPTSHEISLIYALPVKKPAGPSIIRSIRFR